MNKKYWISVYFNQDVPDNKIKELIKQSYDIVYQSLPKRKRDVDFSAVTPFIFHLRRTFERLYVHL